MMTGGIDVNEKTPNLVEELIKKLDASSEVIEDLKTVLDTVQIDFDVRILIIIIQTFQLQRDKFYTEGLFNGQATTTGNIARGGGG